MDLKDASAVLGVCGGIVLFIWALYQWQDAQQWRRADKLENLIKEFDNDELLSVGKTVLDWTRRTIVFKNSSVTITNTDALLALRIHGDLPEGEMSDNQVNFPDSQPLIRDALDSLLNYFDRLCIALNTRLLDVNHARVFFRYWVWQLVSYNSHEVKEAAHTTVGAQGTVPARIARYIGEYGNIELIVLLCEHFGISPPMELVEELMKVREKRPIS